MRSNSQNPASYYYLDQEGIHSIYTQTVGRLETERSVSVEKSLSGKMGVGAKLKNLLVKALLGAEFEANAEVSGSSKSTEQTKHVVRTENELSALLKALEQTGEPVLFSHLAEAAECLRAGTGKVFIAFEDVFNAPQIQAGKTARSITEDGYLILQKGMGDDYDYRDDYYKNLDIPVLLHAGIDKMPAGTLSGSSHLAVRLRGHYGKSVPFSVFGTLAYTPAYFQIKPYAIWL